jgi:hypothetical protein
MADAMDREAASGPALLGLPRDRGTRFQEEWAAHVTWIRIVHAAEVSHEVEPAGAPRLGRSA